MQRSASYAVIRCVPDLARGEHRNVGVVVWDDTGFRVTVDPDAARRVAQEGRHLAEDSVLQLAQSLRERLSNAHRGQLESALRVSSYFYSVSDTLTATVETPSEDPLKALADRLTDRLVRVRKVSFSSYDLKAETASRLKPLIKSHVVSISFPVDWCRSGIVRVVDFYRNSGVNAALDVLNLNVQRVSECQSRIDAQAYKVQDMLHGYAAHLSINVLCALPADPDRAAETRRRLTLLETEGAKVFIDSDEATSVLNPR